jgi:Protein of unknown function (DUF3086)
MNSDETQIQPTTQVSNNSETTIPAVGAVANSNDNLLGGNLMQKPSETTDQLEQRIAYLQQQERELTDEIAALQANKKTLSDQLIETQANLGQLVQESLRDLEQRRQTLQIAVEQLERRQERIRTEMKTTFAGVSQDLAIRVQGFKDYLVGSLQDLANAAEQLDLVAQPTSTSDTVIIQEAAAPKREAPTPKFGEQSFDEDAKQIEKLLDQYRTRPDYYGPPWQLRRTFEPIHAERASYWFFTQGGKGALRSMGSRLQNILVSSAIISILRSLYGDYLCALILANTPERLGEWRRGLQDCLGITRSDFGPEGGIMLFEAPEALAARAERLQKDGEMPLIIVDEAEDQISLSVLQFPLWLAFARDPQAPNYSFDR